MVEMPIAKSHEVCNGGTKKTISNLVFEIISQMWMLNEENNLIKIVAFLLDWSFEKWA